MWMMPLHLHVNQKSDYDYDDTRHQTVKFSYNFKAKKYDENLMNKNQSEPKHFGAFMCD